MRCFRKINSSLSDKFRLCWSSYVLRLPNIQIYPLLHARRSFIYSDLTSQIVFQLVLCGWSNSELRSNVQVLFKKKKKWLFSDRLALFITGVAFCVSVKSLAWRPLMRKQACAFHILYLVARAEILFTFPRLLPFVKGKPQYLVWVFPVNISVPFVSLSHTAYGL